MTRIEDEKSDARILWATSFHGSESVESGQFGSGIGNSSISASLRLLHPSLPALPPTTRAEFVSFQNEVALDNDERGSLGISESENVRRAARQLLTSSWKCFSVNR